jgi:methylated-DNA-protein-cysteine methyltransferase-like protein
VASAPTKPDTNDPDDDNRFQRVWDVIEGIPPGCVINYGEVARLAGCPGRARMVGMALGRAPKKRQLPWHRIVNAQGKISFPEGSAKAKQQRQLLEAEGVEFHQDTIDLEEFSPGRAVDRLLWGP